MGAVQDCRQFAHIMGYEGTFFILIFSEIPALPHGPRIMQSLLKNSRRLARPVDLEFAV
jgi:hypothetical protein